MNKAFAIYHPQFEALLVYSAETRGQATHAAYSAAREAGYETVRWTDFRVKRARHFDSLAAEPGRYPIGYHARSYDLIGNFCGYDQYGCLCGLRMHPRAAYENIDAEAAP